MTTPTYDAACYALAEHFLQDDALDDIELHEMLCCDLAREIQQAIEDWLFIHVMAERSTC